MQLGGGECYRNIILGSYDLSRMNIEHDACIRVHEYGAH